MNAMTLPPPYRNHAEEIKALQDQMAREAHRRGEEHLEKATAEFDRARQLSGRRPDVSGTRTMVAVGVSAMALAGLVIAGVSWIGFVPVAF